MAPKPARESGFTLLEVLVGLAIFSVLMVSLYSGYRMGMRSWEAGEAQVDDANQMRVVSGFIRSHLTRAYPVSIRDDNKWELQFEGEKERLAFVTEVPGHLGLGGLHQVIIEIDGDDEDDRRLKLTRKLFHPDVLEEDDADESSQIHEAMLIDDLVEAKFSYYGAERGRDPEWHDEWDGQSRLPKLVRLETSSKLSGAWPEIVVRFLIDGPRRTSTRADRADPDAAPADGEDAAEEPSGAAEEDAPEDPAEDGEPPRQ